jgi:TetR/AcrR family transcriptional regulator, transcriptional repressor for nem operon
LYPIKKVWKKIIDRVEGVVYIQTGRYLSVYVDSMAHKGSQTRKNIIEKSLQLFSVKGYFNTSVNDILEVTQLTKGGLYGHFRSKEDIWNEVYEEAVNVWNTIVFRGIREIADPLERLGKASENYLHGYIGGRALEGGCFFLNMLVELAGQSEPMTGRILEGIEGFSKLIKSWLEEADEKHMLKPGLRHEELAHFIVISLVGASALYIGSRDPIVLEQASNQVRFYIEQLIKKEK